MKHFDGDSARTTTLALRSLCPGIQKIKEINRCWTVSQNDLIVANSPKLIHPFRLLRLTVPRVIESIIAEVPGHSTPLPSVRNSLPVPQNCQWNRSLRFAKLQSLKFLGVPGSSHTPFDSPHLFHKFPFHLPPAPFDFCPCDFKW